MKLTRKDRSTRSQIYLKVITCTRNRTWTGLGLNPGLRGDRPATNRLCHGTTWHEFSYSLISRHILWRTVDCWDYTLSNQEDTSKVCIGAGLGGGGLGLRRVIIYAYTSLCKSQIQVDNPSQAQSAADNFNNTDILWDGVRKLKWHKIFRIK
jgi:hypothetical protein